MGENFVAMVNSATREGVLDALAKTFDGTAVDPLVFLEAPDRERAFTRQAALDRD